MALQEFIVQGYAMRQPCPKWFVMVSLVCLSEPTISLSHTYSHHASNTKNPRILPLRLVNV